MLTYSLHGYIDFNSCCHLIDTLFNLELSKYSLYFSITIVLSMWRCCVCHITKNIQFKKKIPFMALRPSNHPTKPKLCSTVHHPHFKYISLCHVYIYFRVYSVYTWSPILYWKLNRRVCLNSKVIFSQQKKNGKIKATVTL